MAVVGQGAIDPARLRIDGEPLRTVHFGSTQQITGLSRFNEYFTLICKSVSSSERALAMHHWNPLAFAIGIKPCDMQHAMV